MGRRVAAAVIAVVVIAGIALIVVHRYRILQYSVETLLRKTIPKYVSFDAVRLDFSGREVKIINVRVQSPPDFTYRYFLEIGEISCRFSLPKGNVLEGIRLTDPVFHRGVVYIERLADGRVNVVEMRSFIARDAAQAPASAAAVPAAQAQGAAAMAAAVKLPREFLFKNGKVIFMDRMVQPRPHMITFDGIDASVTLEFDEGYRRILHMASTGSGLLNGLAGESVRWTISLNPQTPRLTMSNRFEVEGVDIISFQPYYDPYSPFIFKKGRFSGTLVFDFDNGSIGAMNEVRLSDIVFYIKAGQEGAELWGTDVQSLAKYFSSSYGDIVFDFKIKGDMRSPKFFLGPISKKALTAMIIDRMSGVLSALPGSAPGSAVSSLADDIEKAKGYLEIIKGLAKK